MDRKISNTGRLVGSLGVVFVCTALMATPARDTATTKHAKHPATKKAVTGASKVSQTHGKKTSGRKTRRARGQQKIDPERSRQIQEALMREHYLPEGTTSDWNQSSETAMRKFQADHGWQTKQVPDSRALIALGLGPSNHLLNPESAMTSMPMKSANNSAPSATSDSPK